MCAKLEQQLPMMVGIQYNHHDFHYYELSYSCNKTSFLRSELLPSGLELCYEAQPMWLGPLSYQGRVCGARKQPPTLF